MRHWIDVTRPMGDSMMCWPGRRPPELTWEKRLADGDHCNVSQWTMSAHTGTHIDAPLHFIHEGQSIDQVAPDVLAGPCRVIDLEETACAPLDRDQAEALRGESRLLIRTRHSMPAEDYAEHGPLMTPDAARILVEAGLVMLGTDRLSVDDAPATDYALHRLLLGARCTIVEGLCLADVRPGPYEVFALPLRIEGAEASPARVLLSARRD